MPMVGGGAGEGTVACDLWSCSVRLRVLTIHRYEEYDPSHKALRGRAGYSKGDTEAVVFVSQ